MLLRLVTDKFCKANQQSAQSNAKFVNEALTTLEHKQCIQRVAHQPHIYARHTAILVPIPPDNRASIGRTYLLASTVRYL